MVIKKSDMTICISGISSNFGYDLQTLAESML